MSARHLLTIAVLVLSGCATVHVAPPRRQLGSFPELGVRTTVNTGQVMVASFDYAAQMGATLGGAVRKSGMWNYRLEVGAQLARAEAGGKIVYCQGTECLEDSNGDGQFDRAWTSAPMGLVDGGSIPPVPFRVVEHQMQDGFKYELIYQGLDNGVVRIAYREYLESLARPAFSQDLTYTLSAEGITQVRFRTLAMIIHAADNNEITFTVNTGLQRSP